MTTKAPKKKESKDAVNSIKDTLSSSVNEERQSARRKTPVPLWPEWNDQDIAIEKWDSGKKEKDRGRSPTATVHYYEDPEGRIELPVSLKYRCKYWKRPVDILGEKIPVVVSGESLTASSIDLLSSNAHIMDSELLRHITASITSLYELCGKPHIDEEMIGSTVKIKPSSIREIKDIKAEKGKKEQESSEEALWKPWDLIWPKENPKANSLPVCNSYGKYAVKIYWMGCYRKIIVDDTVPCDENMTPLLPFINNSASELWPLLVTKALIKVASLDYLGGENNSELGDVNFVHCLTGWLPEPIPLLNLYKEETWNLLLKVLPNWKLHQPKPPASEEVKGLSVEEETVSESNLKETKDAKIKKEDKKDDKKIKPVDMKNLKEKSASAHLSNKNMGQTPEVVIFASFSNPPIQPCKVSDLKEMADSSEKLRQFGLSHCLPHPVHVTNIRNCPLVPPPVSVPIPRWKLIRQKKKKEIVEPLCHSVEEKPPKFLELKSPFFNYNVSPIPLSGHISPMKWDKFKPPTPLESVFEEDQTTFDKTLDSNRTPSEANSVVNETVLKTQESLETDNVKKISISSTVTSVSPNKLNKRVKSSKDGRKSILKESKSSNQEAKLNVPDITTSEDMQSHDSNRDSVVIPDLLENEKPLVEIQDNIKDLWMDFDDFCQCFQTLWIYHKPKTYNKIAVDTKCPDPRLDKSKKASGHNITPAGRNTLSPSTSSLMATVSNTDPVSPFVLVDCLKETELVVSFSSFSSWFQSFNSKSKEETDGDIFTPILTGTLIIEPYSCKKITAPKPLLRINTTAIKTSVLTLKPGRHVLHLLINAPLGYHICLCSSENFIFGDENLMMQHLTNESCRFTEHALSVLKGIDHAIQSFHDVNNSRKQFLIGTESRCNGVRRLHFEELLKSFRKIIKHELRDGYTESMTFAINALQYELYLRLKKFSSKSSRKGRPVSMTLPNRRFSIEIPAAHVKFSVPNIQYLTSQSKPNAATLIQATYKGYYERKLKNAHLHGTRENTVVSEALTKIWSHIENNLESVSSQIYRSMFKHNPDLFTLFPFHADEWNKIEYSDYTGSYTEQAPETWFVIYREIFLIDEPVLLMCKFFCVIPSCVLKVIDNDTGNEIKTVFKNIVPQVLTKNKLGYTFVAIAYSGATSTHSGKYRLRIIGDKETLPYPIRDSVNSSFVVKEVRDYYVPNRYQRIFRYSVKVNEDILTTLRLNTFKDNVLIQLKVLDNGEMIYTCDGKGQLIIPAVLFYRDRYVQDENKKLSRPSSQTGSIRSSSKVSSKRPPSSRKSISPDKSKRKSNAVMETNEDEITEDQVHKYAIEAYVLRESWPLTKTEWNFLETLKLTEKNEDESDAPVKHEVSGKTSAGKNRKTGGGKDSKANRSRPESQAQSLFDSTKSNWLLQCIVDSHMENAIEIKKDTEREDEIKAIKAAWEAVEPGRMAKALESRRKYVESHTILKNPPPNEKLNDSNEMVEETDETVAQEHNANVDTEAVVSPLPIEDDGELYLTAPVKETDTMLQPFDISPYIKSTGKKILLDDLEEERIRCARERDFTDFDALRDMVLSMRENDRLSRNVEKEKQLAQYEELQAKLDTARHELHKARLAYRIKFIEQPEVEIHEVEATERSKKRTPSPKRKPSKAVKSASKTKKK